MNETQTIPWKRISVEAVAIVASILLAFAIDAWWDDFRQQRLSQTLLTDLEVAFAENVTLLEENIKLVTRYQEILKQFIEIEPDEAAQIPPEQTFDMLQSIWRPITAPNNNSLLIARLDSEDGNLSEYPVLQNAIARWRSEVNELDERRVQLAASESEALLALGRYPEVGLAWTARESGAIPQLSDSVMRKARGDKEVMAIAARKAWQNRIHLNSLRSNRESSVAVLELIRMAMDR